MYGFLQRTLKFIEAMSYFHPYLCFSRPRQPVPPNFAEFQREQPSHRVRLVAGKTTDGWTPNTLLQTHCFFCAGMGWANMMMVTGWFLRHGSPKFDYDETTWTAAEIIEKSQLTWVSGITSCQCNTLYPQHHVVASRATMCHMRFPQYLPESQPGLDLGASVLSKKPLRLVLVFLRAVHRGLPAWLGDGCEIVHFLQMRRSWTPKKIF